MQQEPEFKEKTSRKVFSEADQNFSGKEYTESKEAEEPIEKDVNLTLRIGSRGDQVRALQEELGRLGMKVYADGIYGKETEQAVMEYQERMGMRPTGMADQETQERLYAESKDKSESLSVRLHAISDRPLEGKEEDALGFAPYVDAMVAFLRSRDTQPPLAIGVNAPWGRGKTSFMKMVESELKAKSRWFGPIRFATEWFNPWKYSNDEQVWAAFVAVIARCIRGGLSPWGRIKFETRRFYNNIQNHKLAFFTRLLAFAALSAMFFIVALDPQMKKFALTLFEDQWGANVKTALENTWAGPFIPWLGGAVLVFLFYTKVIQTYNMDLLDYLKATDFKDKIGTLTQFEEEINLLNSCMPKKSKLKVAIFVDDLDRCKPTVLWEVIEALQLLAVSRRTIFILGMDLKIVANTINTKYNTLSQEMTESGGTFQHGWGYRFLEKVIQTRLSVPAYGPDQLNTFVMQTLGTEKPPESEVPEKDNKEQEPKEQGPDAMEGTDSISDIPKDSDEVVDTIRQYGPGYFKNPRRLKRFINNFRLHAYLANMTGFAVSLDRLARFIILSEKWPGLVDFFYSNPKECRYWLENGSFPDQDHTSSDSALLFNNAVSLLQNPRVLNLLTKDKAGVKDVFTFEELSYLCEWYGFRYYK